MPRPLEAIVGSYARDAPLERASTIPADWYIDGRLFELERRTVFARAWQFAGRVDQVNAPGRFLSKNSPDPGPGGAELGDTKCHVNPK